MDRGLLRLGTGGKQVLSAVVSSTSRVHWKPGGNCLYRVFYGRVYSASPSVGRGAQLRQGKQQFAQWLQRRLQQGDFKSLLFVMVNPVTPAAMDVGTQEAGSSRYEP